MVGWGCSPLRAHCPLTVRCLCLLQVIAAPASLSSPSPACPCHHRLQEEARQLFRNPASTEFVIVTIPTIMAVSESSRLASSLRQEGVPLRTIVINQVSSWAAGQHACCCVEQVCLLRHLVGTVQRAVLRRGVSVWTTARQSVS
jgi:anion-transporting  ArsA/GET3 family ATPase